MARNTDGPQEEGGRPPDKEADRHLRRAEALRRNLRRRKEQVREREGAQSGHPDSPGKL